MSILWNETEHVNWFRALLDLATALAISREQKRANFAVSPSVWIDLAENRGASIRFAKFDDTVVAAQRRYDHVPLRESIFWRLSIL